MEFSCQPDVIHESLTEFKDMFTTLLVCVLLFISENL